jgi:hypothetical protein
MYVCVYVYMRVCIYVYIHATLSVALCMYVCACTYVCVFVRVCANIRVHILCELNCSKNVCACCMYICVWKRESVCRHISVIYTRLSQLRYATCLCLCVCVYVCMCMYVYIYATPSLVMHVYVCVDIPVHVCNRGEKKAHCMHALPCYSHASIHDCVSRARTTRLRYVLVCVFMFAPLYMGQNLHVTLRMHP